MIEIIDDLKIKDNVNIKVYDKGQLVQEITDHNVVTEDGLNLLRDFMRGESPDYLEFFAVGDSTQDISSTYSNLPSEVSRNTITSFTPSDQNLNVRYFLPSGVANGSTLRTAGIFNSSSSGVMFAGVDHEAIQKTSSISVTYSWDIDLG